MTLFPLPSDNGHVPTVAEDQGCPDEPTALYRLFDSLGNLLYLGIAGNVGRRLNEHSKTQPWARAITSATIEHFETRREAERAEKTAIHNEQPLFNVAWAGPRKQRWCQPLVLCCGGQTATFTDVETFWHMARAIETGKAEGVFGPEPVPREIDELWRECVNRYVGALLRGWVPEQQLDLGPDE
jgi:predicted GIY-YIG superfamily endonuclease